MNLLEFINKAHKNTYAAPRKRRFRSEPVLEGHKEYRFIEGDWSYHDAYAGWHWPPGREVVLFKKEPVWCMSYQGKVSEKLKDDFVERVYAFLKRALLHAPPEMPFRGPERFVEEDFSYTFSLEGDKTYFTAKEIIRYKEEIVFFQDVMGTLIK